MTHTLTHVYAYIYKKLPEISFSLCCIVFGLYVWSVSTQRLLFGSVAGRWYYQYAGQITPRLFTVTIGMLVATGVLGWFTYTRLRRAWKMTIVAWLLWGCVFQMIAASTAPTVLADVIQAKGTNPYYIVSREHSLRDVLWHFEAIAAAAPIHIRSNMPGKLLFYYALEAITLRPEMIGYLIMLISSIVGGVLLYWVVWLLFEDRRIALYSMILYVVIPSRTYFAPLLNTISPLFAICSFIVLLLYIRRPSRMTAVVYGVSVLGMVFMEPMLLVTGVIHTAVIFGYLKTRRIQLSDVFMLMLYAIMSILICSIGIFYLFGFDVFGRYMYMVADAREFNVTAFRGYRHWAFFNFIDLFFASGISAMLVWIWFSLFTMHKAISRSVPPSSQFQISHWVPMCMTFGVLSMVLITDAIGIARGETQRLWIFMMVCIQIVAAYAFATRLPKWVFAFAICMTIIQTLLTVQLVDFL